MRRVKSLAPRSEAQKPRRSKKSQPAAASNKEIHPLFTLLRDSSCDFVGEPLGIEKEMPRMKFRVVLLLLCFAAISVISVSSMNAGIKSKPVTFNKDVAPILFKSCAECHRPG